MSFYSQNLLEALYIRTIRICGILSISVRVQRSLVTISEPKYLYLILIKHKSFEEMKNHYVLDLIVHVTLYSWLKFIDYVIAIVEDSVRDEPSFMKQIRSFCFQSKYNPTKLIPSQKRNSR